MASRRKRDKIIIFIDNSNLFHSFKKLNFLCDYEKLKEILTSNRELIDIILYTGIMYPVRDKDKAWLNKLKHLGYNVKTRAVKVAPNGKKTEKRIDVLMAVEIIASAYEKVFDTVVIVSGDADFVPVVKKLQEINKNIEIWSFEGLLSEHLKNMVGEGNYHYIENILEKIKFQ